MAIPPSTGMRRQPPPPLMMDASPQRRPPTPGALMMDGGAPPRSMDALPRANPGVGLRQQQLGMLQQGPRPGDLSLLPGLAPVAQQRGLPPGLAPGAGGRGLPPNMGMPSAGSPADILRQQAGASARMNQTLNQGGGGSGAGAGAPPSTADGFSYMGGSQGWTGRPPEVARTAPDPMAQARQAAEMNRMGSQAGAMGSGAGGAADQQRGAGYSGPPPGMGAPGQAQMDQMRAAQLNAEQNRASVGLSGASALAAPGAQQRGQEVGGLSSQIGAVAPDSQPGSNMSSRGEIGPATSLQGATSIAPGLSSNIAQQGFGGGGGGGGGGGAGYQSPEALRAAMMRKRLGG